MLETLQHVLQSNSCEQPQGLLLCAVHASLLDEGFVPCRLAQSVNVYRVEFIRGTEALIKLNYRHSRPGQPAMSHQDLICTLLVNALGDYVIANASVEGCRLRQVTLSGNERLPVDPSISELLDLYKLLTSAFTRPETAYTKPTREGFELQNLEELWITLKNHLAWPLRCDVHTALGLTPPVSLLLLPQELMDRILHVMKVCNFTRPLWT